MSYDNYLFVYGSLLREFEGPEARWLSEVSEFVSYGFARGSLYRIDWYCGAVFDLNAHTKVFGTILVLEDTPKILSFLDIYEGIGTDDVHDHLFYRLKVEVETDDFKLIPCWSYGIQPQEDKSNIISSGKFIP